jgi:hypothetical protein
MSDPFGGAWVPLRIVKLNVTDFVTPARDCRQFKNRRHIARIVQKGGPGPIALAGSELWHSIVEIDRLDSAAQVGRRHRELNRLARHHWARRGGQRVGNRRCSIRP